MNKKEVRGFSLVAAVALAVISVVVISENPANKGLAWAFAISAVICFIIFIVVELWLRAVIHRQHLTYLKKKFLGEQLFLKIRKDSDGYEKDKYAREVVREEEGRVAVLDNVFGKLSLSGALPDRLPFVLKRDRNPFRFDPIKIVIPKGPFKFIVKGVKERKIILKNDVLGEVKAYRRDIDCDPAKGSEITLKCIAKKGFGNGDVDTYPLIEISWIVVT